MELARTSWKKALTLSSLATYSPYVLIGLLGFPGDASCRARWWEFILLLPGLAPSHVFLFYPQIEIAGVPLRKMQPDWLAAAWSQIVAPLQAAPDWVRLSIAAAFTLMFIVVLAVMFQRLPQRGAVRGSIFGGGLVLGGLSAALTYAMFLA